MDSLTGKSESQIREEVLKLAAELTGLNTFKPAAPLRAFLEVFILIVAGIYENVINPMALQFNLDTATGRSLSMWGALLGVSRQGATKAGGIFQGTAYGAGSLAAGSWLQITGTTLRFKVSESLTFEAGSFSIPVEAEFPGSPYNLQSAPVHSLKVVANLEKIEIPEGWLTAYGQEEENDPSLRERIKAKWSAQGDGNPPAKYALAALSVPGVTACRVIRTPRGYGSTDIIIAAENGSPSPALLEQVRGALAASSLICRDLQIKGPQIKNFTLQVVFSGDLTPEELALQLESFCHSLEIGQRFQPRELYSFLEPLNLDSLEIIQPARNVEVAAYQILVPEIGVENV